MPEHTPGPWKQSPKASDAIISGALPEEPAIWGPPEEASHEYYGGRLIAESVAPQDRPLIIAAPDLLDACEAALRWMGVCTLDDEQETRDLLKAAIAKTRGEELPDA